MGPGLIHQSESTQTDQISAQEQHELLVFGVTGQVSVEAWQRGYDAPKYNHESLQHLKPLLVQFSQLSSFTPTQNKHLNQRMVTSVLLA